MRFSRTKRSAIGLDIGPRWVAAVQLERNRDGDHVSGASRLPRRNPGADITADELAGIVEAISRQGLEGHDVILAVPPAQLLSGVFDLPPRASGAPLEQIAHNELARTSHVEPTDLRSACWELPSGMRETEGSQVAAVGCTHAHAAELLDLFDACGLRVRALDALGAALARAVRPLCPHAPALAAALHVGWSGSLLVVIRGDTIVYERWLVEAGLQPVAQQLERKLGIDADTACFMLMQVGLGEAPAELADEAELVAQSRALIAESVEALATEARASAAYAGRRYGESVARLLITGDGAAIADLAPRLGRRLECEARNVGLADVVGPTPDYILEAIAEPTGLVLAAGLSLHEESWT